MKRVVKNASHPAKLDLDFTELIEEVRQTDSQHEDAEIL